MTKVEGISFHGPFQVSFRGLSSGDYLSPSQAARFIRAFCGLRDCYCSVRHIDWHSRGRIVYEPDGHDREWRYIED